MATIIQPTGNKSEHVGVLKSIARFRAVRSRLNTILNALSPAQQQKVLDTLDDWTNSTQADKNLVFIAGIGLAYVMIGFLINREFKE